MCFQNALKIEKQLEPLTQRQEQALRKRDKVDDILNQLTDEHEEYVHTYGDQASDASISIPVSEYFKLQNLKVIY